MKVTCIIALAMKNRTPDGQSILFVLKLQRLFQHLEDKNKFGFVYEKSQLKVPPLETSKAKSTFSNSLLNLF